MKVSDAIAEILKIEGAEFLSCFPTTVLLDAAAKAGLSESSIRKVEAGSPHITVGAYLALLDVFGLPTAFDSVIARGDDTLGEALGRNAMRKRARAPLASREMSRGGAPRGEPCARRPRRPG